MIACQKEEKDVHGKKEVKDFYAKEDCYYLFYSLVVFLLAKEDSAFADYPTFTDLSDLCKEVPKFNSTQISAAQLYKTFTSFELICEFI